MKSQFKREIISKAIVNRLLFLNGTMVLSEETHKVKFQDYPNRQEQTFSLSFDKKELETKELEILTQRTSDVSFLPTPEDSCYLVHSAYATDSNFLPITITDFVFTRMYKL